MAAGCLPCVYHVGTFPGVFTGISPDLVTTRDALGEGAQTSLTCVHALHGPGKVSMDLFVYTVCC